VTWLTWLDASALETCPRATAASRQYDSTPQDLLINGPLPPQWPRWLNSLHYFRRGLASWLVWMAPGGTFCREFATLSAARVLSKHIKTGLLWSLGLVSVMRRSAAFCTRCNGLMVDSEGLRVQRSNSRVGWARVPWPVAWWLLHQQSDGFDAVASTERSNCWQHDWCVASSSAHCRGRRQDLVRLWPVGWRHFRLKASGHNATNNNCRDCNSSIYFHQQMLRH